MFKLIISYPNSKEEVAIITRFCTEDLPHIKKAVSKKELLEIHSLVKKVYVDPSIISFIADLVSSTRNPLDYKLENISHYISFGASPRASLNLTQASKALALIRGRDYVKEEDVEKLIFDVLRHRITLSYDGIMAKETVGSILSTILNKIKPRVLQAR